MNCLLEQHAVPANNDHDMDRIDLVLSLSAAETNIDVAIVAACTVQQALLKTRAKHDGHAARHAAARKKDRYPNLRVLPFVLEDFGRPGREAIGLVRALAAMDNEATASESATHLWQSIQAIVQGHTAQIIRTAEHHRAM